MGSQEDLVIPAEVLGESNLRPSAKLLFARLLELARGGGLAFRSRSALAADLALGCRTVEAGLRTLEAGGWIVLEVSHNGRGRPRGWRVRGAAPNLTALRATTTGEGPEAGLGRVNQLMLFDTWQPKGEDARSPDSAKTL